MNNSPKGCALMRSVPPSVCVLAGDVGLAIQALPDETTHFSFKGVS